MVSTTQSNPAHCQLIEPLVPGSPVEIQRPGRLVVGGYRFHSGYSPTAVLLRAPGGELMRTAPSWVRPSA